MSMWREFLQQPLEPQKLNRFLTHNGMKTGLKRYQQFHLSLQRRKSSSAQPSFNCLLQCNSPLIQHYQHHLYYTRLLFPLTQHHQHRYWHCLMLLTHQGALPRWIPGLTNSWDVSAGSGWRYFDAGIDEANTDEIKMPCICRWEWRSSNGDDFEATYSGVGTIERLLEGRYKIDVRAGCRVFICLKSE